VALHYAHSDDGALSAVEEIRKAGGCADAFQADFRDLDEARGLASRAVEFLGGLDVLVNNAGVTMNRLFEEVTPEQFDTIYHINVRSPFFVTQGVLPALVDSRGAIVNITSIHAFEGCPEHSVYAGAKGAIVAQTRELAIELAMKGVRVNAIAPGATHVQSHDKVMPDLDPEAFARSIPCGFWGEPSDIARVVVFLASDDARYIVGQTLIVDGGTTSWMPFNDSFRQRIPYQFGKGYVPGV
jgi:NAD(P)-dependent dehydrogenase (short-subunit alcohol dehydrogenase family)